MLKKVISGVLALFLGLLAVGFVGTPANAGKPIVDNVTYCQAQGNGGYHLIENAPVESLTDKKGNMKQGGINENDIVPPFDWDFGGGNHGSFAGTQGWDISELHNFIDRGCVPADTRKIAVPPTPIYVPGTCSNPQGTFTNETAEGADQTYKKVIGDLEPTWVINYTPAEGYKFAEDAVTTFRFPVVGPNASDPLFDTSKGICRMPDTGAGDIKSEHILYAGILIFSGLLLTTLARRKA